MRLARTSLGLSAASCSYATSSSSLACSSRAVLRAPSASVRTHSRNSAVTSAAPAARALHTLMSAKRPAAGAAASSSERVAAVGRHLHGSAGVSMSASNSRSAGSGAQPSSSSAKEATEPLVQAFSNGGLRVIQLNRPKALNALNTEMVRLIRKHLGDIMHEPSTTAPVIALRGTGRALCSGGDVLAVVNAANSQNASERQKALQFFQEEFELDHQIAKLGERSSIVTAKDGKAKRSPKAFISFMDGITMGGGVGLSLHAPFRVATEKTLFAMPETGIGYFPDVGVTRCLARLDGRIGQYLGLTGARISGEEAYLIGVASHYIPSSSVETVLDRLAHLIPSSVQELEGRDIAERVDNLLEEYTADPFGADAPEKVQETLRKSPFLGEKRVALDYAFGQPSAEAIFSALGELASGAADTQAARELASPAWGLSRGVTPEIASWAETTLKTLKTKSPRSLKVSHLAIQEARRFDVDEAFRFDMRLATAFCDFGIGRDFFEGVTFTLTKDPATGERRKGVAKWDPPTLAQVDDAKIRAQFFGDAKAAKAAGMTMEVPQLEGVPTKQDESREAKRAREAALRGRGPLGWEPAHNPHALPSEAECAALLEGSHPAASSVRLSVDEMIDVLRRFKGDKPGLDRKLRDWAQRSAKQASV